MPRRKQPRRTDLRDLNSILRLTYEQGLSVRAVAERLKLSKTTVATYLLRAREAGCTRWPPPDDLQLDAKGQIFRRVGRPPQDLSEPDWPTIALEMKRKGVTLSLLWQEYRAAHPNGYGYTWFCGKYLAFVQRRHAVFRNRHEAGAVMQTDYAGQTVPVMDPSTGEVRSAQIFVAVLGASSLTFVWATPSQKLPDWIEAQQRALAFFGGVPKAIVCDNLKAAVAKALWFEPTLNETFAAMAQHYDTTILPTRPRRPPDKGKVEGAVLIVERWILARLRRQSFFSIESLNAQIAGLNDELNDRMMRRVGKSRREIFEAVEHEALAPLPSEPFEYAEWKKAKVHPDYHVEADENLYSVPHVLLGRWVDVRMTHRVVEVFYDHKRVASHVRASQRVGHITVRAHMPKAHQRYADLTPARLIDRAKAVGPNTATLVERLMRDRPHPEQGYRSAMGVLALARRYDATRLEGACDRALTINAVSCSSVDSILRTGLDRARPTPPPPSPAPPHANIRGGSYYR
jgi:transposase